MRPSRVSPAWISYPSTRAVSVCRTAWNVFLSRENPVSTCNRRKTRARRTCSRFHAVRVAYVTQNLQTAADAHDLCAPSQRVGDCLIPAHGTQPGQVGEGHFRAGQDDGRRRPRLVGVAHPAQSNTRLAYEGIEIVEVGDVRQLHDGFL